MGGGCGPNCITFTINTLLANLNEVDKESIEDSITEILKGLGSGNVTFGEFREGSAIVDASPQNFVSADAVREVVKAAGDIKTLGDQRFIVAKIDEAPVEYTDKLIIVPTDDNEPILYINDGAADTVEKTDWEAQGIAPDTIKSVAFGNSVTTIGAQAFRQCTSLTQVTIPNSVTTIGAEAFNLCVSLTQVTIPGSVATIGGAAFFFCSSLTQVTIPGSVTTIGDFAFNVCRSLAKIIVDTANDNYSSRDGVLFNKNQTSLIQYPVGNTRTQYPIPGSVTTIGAQAFIFCVSLTQVTIPGSVTTIGNNAFRGCTSLASVKLNNTNITTIPFGAFDQCPAVIDPTNFVVANAMPDTFGFEDANGAFSNRSVNGGGLQFGTDDSGGAGFKTVTVVT